MRCWTPSATTPTRCRRRSAIRPSAHSCSSAPTSGCSSSSTVRRSPSRTWRSRSWAACSTTCWRSGASGSRSSARPAATRAARRSTPWPGRTNVDIVILYPEGRVSEVQRRQMTTVAAENVQAVAVEGTFDDCQDLVKAMFNDPAFRDRHRLSAVNSINWARVMAQIVYYATTAATFGGRPVSFAVPTGNFGNVLAGWIARRMGAPIHRLLIGSNCNDILTRFLTTRIMATAEVVPTLSPSMDIQVSSNFERLLFEVNDRDGGMTAEQLRQLRATGHLAVEADQYEEWLAPVFRARVRRCRHAGHHAHRARRDRAPGRPAHGSRHRRGARPLVSRAWRRSRWRRPIRPSSRTRSRRRRAASLSCHPTSPTSSSGPSAPLSCPTSWRRSRPSLHVTPPVAKVTAARSPEQAAPPGSAVVPTSPRWIPVLSDGGLRCQPPTRWPREGWCGFHPAHRRPAGGRTSSCSRKVGTHERGDPRTLECWKARTASS